MQTVARNESQDDRLHWIRSSCRRVADRARFVRIRTDRIDAFAQQLAVDAIVPPQLDTEHHFVGTPEETAAFFLTLDAINFGSGYFPHLTKRPGLSGYFTIASTLTERFRFGGPLSARELSAMTPETCTRLFRQNPKNEPIGELMQLFAQALRDLGDWLERRFQGSALRMIEAADGSAARLVDLVCEMPLFRDETTYDAEPVYFYKRAQILASDVALALGQKAPTRFTDLDRLTIFADNLVPHVLRLDGLLEYTDDLRQRIDVGELLSSGSAEEIELRACAVDTVERVIKSLREQGSRATARDLDIVLWNRGQAPRYKRAAPRHRTRSVFY